MEHLTKKDIEFYLLNFEYKELNDEQLDIVSKEIKSENEYNSLRNFMLTLTSEKEEGIIPPPAIKASLMQEFAKANNSGFWATTGLFLFPKDKPAYAKPGMQLLAIAASIVLIFTVFVDFEQKQSDVAMNEAVNEEQPIHQNQKNAELEKTLEEGEAVSETPEEPKMFDKESNQESLIVDAEEEMTNALSGEKELRKEEPISNGETLTTDQSYAGNTSFTYANEDHVDFQNQEVQTLTSTTIANELFVEDESAEMEESIDDVQVISGYTQPTTESNSVTRNASAPEQITNVETSVANKVVSDNRRENLKKNKADIDLPMNSRTLDQDKSLIGVLYTAM